MTVPSEYITDFRSHIEWVVTDLIKKHAHEYVYKTSAFGTCPEHLENDVYQAIIEDVQQNLHVEFRRTVDDENTDRFTEITRSDGTKVVWPKVWGEA